MALTNAERQRKHRQKLALKLSQLAPSPNALIFQKIELYLDNFTIDDYQDVLLFGIHHIDHSYQYPLDDFERNFEISAINLICRYRINQAGFPVTWDYLP